MIIKVCGIRTIENIAEIARLPIDMVGLNFYPPSSRYLDDRIEAERFDLLPDEVARVGVFVNMELENVLDKVDEYRLDFVQLHGDETVEYAQAISDEVGVIKVFRINSHFQMEDTLPYDFVNYLLFDQDTKGYGGSGHKFDWSVLQEYKLSVPFLLAGGIGPNDAAEVKTIVHPSFVGIDINSRFEHSPAVKDTHAIEKFLDQLSTL